MRYLFLILTLCILSACSTAQYALIDQKGRTASQHVIDDRQCSVYHYDNGFRYLDTQYYYACMDERGYKLMVSQ